MRKPAETDHPVHELIRERWSPISFSSRYPSAAELGAVLEAARWAPSCYNEQPWRFLLAARDDPPAFERLASCLVEANRAWAAAAPVLVLTVARTTFRRNGKPNRWAWHDVGLATAQLITQAQSLGLVVHPMAGFDAQRARDRLAIPADHEPVAMLALGAPGSVEQLPERLRERERAPRQRDPLVEIVRGAGWDERPAWLRGE